MESETERRVLVRRLVDGTGPGDVELARSVGVSVADDATFARRVLLRSEEAWGRQARAWAPPAERCEGDATLLGRLGVDGIDAVDDVAMLVDVLRGGTLRQRRAAARRLAIVGTSHDALGAIDEATQRIRDEELAGDLTVLRLALGLPVDDDLTMVDARFGELEAAVQGFYEGDAPEPLETLDAEERHRLGAWLRRAPAVVVDHLSALLEGAIPGSVELRLAWLTAVRSADDVRLIPTLASLVDATQRELALEAARALGRIEHAAAHAVLSAAFHRRTTPADRALFGGALALHGDSSALVELRESLRADDPRARLAAVDAIGPIATREDFEPLAALLGTGTVALDAAVVRALGRLGDGRAIRPIRGLRDSDRGRLLAADVESALRSIRAQMELRAEKDIPETGTRAALVVPTASTWARARAAWLVSWARFLSTLGVDGRALRALDRAISVDRQGVAAWIAKGKLFERRGSYGEALAVFRQAIELDRLAVERHARTIEVVARTFLRRAETTLGEGRREIAKGLLDEVSALDLSRAPARLRQALARERERLASEDA